MRLTLSMLTAPICRATKFTHLVTGMRVRVKLTRNTAQHRELKTKTDLSSAGRAASALSGSPVVSSHRQPVSPSLCRLCLHPHSPRQMDAVLVRAADA